MTTSGCFRNYHSLLDTTFRRFRSTRAGISHVFKLSSYLIFLFFFPCWYLLMGLPLWSDSNQSWTLIWCRNSSCFLSCCTCDVSLLTESNCWQWKSEKLNHWTPSGEPKPWSPKTAWFCWESSFFISDKSFFTSVNTQIRYGTEVTQQNEAQTAVLIITQEFVQHFFGWHKVSNWLS